METPSNEAVTFSRDCEAVLIPAGDTVEIPVGTQGNITQALGGSFTIYIAGNLIRVAGHNADAIGQPEPEPLSLPDGAGNSDVESLAWEQMRTVFDPEIPINVVDLGLIYRCEFDHSDPSARSVAIDMTLTAPGCGMGDILVDDVRSKIAMIPTIETINVEFVFDPPWNMEMMSDAAKLQVGML
ncbi:putative Fe-S cluster assembly protein SufT [Salinisphaera sp. USBA-960]|uniref:putative Fe-S cluster assembly protein SufT n=1 Tax=Salinisphaera orenii TaxID=856731 RepID=UPI000DBEA59A|nr:putative Fe-S cluster assembly protein SufT [Salifodinibacter halophilus]NNC26724.1 putative Fe-S cluster assembly protein SufT [Salifodinibacter halophilus]